MNLNFETDGVNFNNKGKPDEIATPQNICDDMSNLFDFTDCNRKIWADIYCKTGNTLESLKKHGVNKENIIAICDNKQSQMLVCRKLYGKILPEIEVEITVKSLEAYKITRRGQVYWVSNWQDIFKNNCHNAYNIVKFVILKEMEKTMSLEFTSQDDFQINNIIMNPPYNNDIYIDFVTLAKNIASNSVVAITPAKFQAKGGEKNEVFRKDIVPYMSDIVFYPVSTDIFDIGESAGISYYTVDKNEHKDKKLKIICDGQKIISTSGEYIQSDAKALVNKSIRGIIDKCSDMSNELGRRLNLHQSYYVKNTDSGHSKTTEKDIEVWGGKAGGEKDETGKQFFLLGYKSESELLRTEGLNKYKACLSCMPTGNNKYGAFDENGMAFGLKEILMLKPNQVPKGSYFPLMCFDTEAETKSFISYFNTRLIRFLIVCSIVGTTISTELFRLVPDPGAFDHIFTDAELYQKYDLTPDEIAIIESVIKERK